MVARISESEFTRQYWASKTNLTMNSICVSHMGERDKDSDEIDKLYTSDG
jgi:hypothetical protein